MSRPDRADNPPNPRTVSQIRLDHVPLPMSIFRISTSTLDAKDVKVSGVDTDCPLLTNMLLFMSLSYSCDQVLSSPVATIRF